MIFSVSQNKAGIFQKPLNMSYLETEALFGENFEIKDKRAGWAYGTLLTDNYSGWIKVSNLGNYIENTHKVSVIRSHIYTSPSSKSLSIMPVSFGSRVKVINKDSFWAEIQIHSNKTKSGFIPEKHLTPNETTQLDWVKTAQLFIGTPYLWGGRSSFGIDCSGLIQLSLDLAEIPFPRNSKTQFDVLKKNMITNSNHQRGDFIYWKGHIGILLNNKEILHSNGHHMCVIVENLECVFSRIGEGLFVRL